MRPDFIPMDSRPKIRYWIPAAAVDEMDLRAEVRALFDRGFGGMEAVVLQMLPESVLCSDDGWGSDHWNRVVDILCDETEKLGMSLDLAAGPGWPLASPALLSADAPGAMTELTYGFFTVRGGNTTDGPLPARRTTHAEGTPKRIAVMAYQVDTEDPFFASRLGETEDTAFGEREVRQPLIVDSYIDLMPFVSSDESICWTAPGDSSQTWAVIAFWEQPAAQRINAGQTLVIDHLSKAGVQAMADYWDPFLSQLKCRSRFDSIESLFCDSLEYDVAMDWSPDLVRFFQERRGYSILPYLPFLGMTDTYPPGDLPAWPSVPAGFRDQVNNDYMEILTQMYCENHLQGLEEMARRHGKTIRYQVAYNKPFEEERCGLFVGIPENEALGRPQFDGQRLMAAAAHLGRKSRYSFECAAQGGRNYAQTYEDLFWWVKRSLMSGMNAQVLHGGSYSGKCTGSNPENDLTKNVAWPGYTGMGGVISNEWGRTPDPAHARGCLDAIARMNTVFRHRARVDCAVFRQKYCNNGNGPDFMNYPDNGALTDAGYSYDFLSEYLLSLPSTEVKDGQMDRDVTGYQALIVPPQECLSTGAMRRICALAREGLAVLLIGDAPSAPLYYCDCCTEDESAAWEAARRDLFVLPSPNVVHVSGFQDVPAVLASRGIRPRAEIRWGQNVMTAVRRDDAGRRSWFAFYGYNRVGTGRTVRLRDLATIQDMDFFQLGDCDPQTIKPRWQRTGAASRQNIYVSLQGCGRVRRYDYWTGDFENLNFIPSGDSTMQGLLSIEDDELILLCMDDEESPADAGNVCMEQLSLYAFVPDTNGETSFLRSHFSKAPSFLRDLSGEKPLLPWHEMDPSLETFSGRGVYEGRILLNRMPMADERVLLCLGRVRDTFRVWVNEKECDFPDQVKKEADITALLRGCENRLHVEVVSDLHNAVLSRPEHSVSAYFKLPFAPRGYGICPTPDQPVRVVFRKQFTVQDMGKEGTQ